MSSAAYRFSDDQQQQLARLATALGMDVDAFQWELHVWHKFGDWSQSVEFRSSTDRPLPPCFTAELAAAFDVGVLILHDGMAAAQIDMAERWPEHGPPIARCLYCDAALPY